MKIHAYVLVAICLSEIATAQAQVVQLPSIRQFSYRGSVLVPDGGSTFLGGNSSYASGSRSRGIPGLPPVPQSQLGRSMMTSGASVSATIIDHEAIDRQMLGQDIGTFTKSIRHPNAPTVADRINEIKSLVRNARSLHRSGQIDASQSTYDLAIQRIKTFYKSPDGPRKTLDRMLAFASGEYARLYPSARTYR